MNARISTLLKLSDTLASGNLGAACPGMVLGFQTLDTGVFGGVVVGLMAYWLHSHYLVQEIFSFMPDSH